MLAFGGTDTRIRMNGFPHNSYESECKNGVLPFMGKLLTRFSIIVDEG